MFDKEKMSLLVEFSDGLHWPILIKMTCPLHAIDAQSMSYTKSKNDVKNIPKNPLAEILPTISSYLV